MSSAPSSTTIISPLITKQSEWMPLIVFGIFCAIILLFVLIIWLVVEYCCCKIYGEQPDAVNPIQSPVDNNQYTSTESYNQVL